MRVPSIVLAAGIALAAGGCGQKASAPAEPAKVRIGLVAKSLGNGFFDAVHKGADEAASELGVDVIFTGPPTPTAEGQVEVLNALIAQRVDAIAVSANDPDALVPTLKRAMQRGIKVISYDSAVDAAARLAHLAPSSDALIGATCARLASEAAPNGGKIAVVSATPTSTNQNLWLAEMKRALAGYPQLTLVDVVYGDDVADKSYREAVALLKRHTDLAALVSLSSVGIVASAKAVEDQQRAEQVKVTGLGLPSELSGYVKRGVVQKFAIWNPIDLGYATTYVAAGLVKAGEAMTPIAAGRMGSIAFAADGVGAMAEPFVYDATNVEQFAYIF